MANNLKRTLLIPAAGTATRMRGLPKFLLPTTIDNVSLIERHILKLRSYFDEVLIGVNPDFIKNLDSILKEDEKIKIYELTTKTMMETVSLLVKKSSNDNFMLIMPDTYFSNYSDIEELLKKYDFEIPSLMCWNAKEFQFGKLGQVLLNSQSNVLEIQDKNPNCRFSLFWGSALFSRIHLYYADEKDSHIGYLFEKLVSAGSQVNGYQISGDYFDCGTQSEYIEMLVSTRQ